MMRPDGVMTLQQLQRHMDRRFDRLERLKADRRDLRRFATKRDLRGFATKRDLRELEVRLEKSLEERLERRFTVTFATKEDLRELRTELVRHMNVVAERIVTDFRVSLDALTAHTELLRHHDRAIDNHERRIADLKSIARSH